MGICIDKAFQPNVPKNKRQIAISKIAEWKMLEKHFRTFVYLAIDEVEPPAVDEDDNTPSRRKNSTGRRNRRRGGRGAASSDPLDWIPSPEESLQSDSGSDPYRLASLLVHKILKSDDWNEEWNATESSLRDSCLANGVRKPATTAIRSPFRVVKFIFVMFLPSIVISNYIVIKPRGLTTYLLLYSNAK